MSLGRVGRGEGGSRGCLDDSQDGPISDCGMGLWTSRRGGQVQVQVRMLCIEEETRRRENVRMAQRQGKSVGTLCGVGWW